QAKRPQDPALDREVREADDERGAEDIQEERVDLVEPPVPEVEAENRLGEVVLEGEDGRPGKQDHEAVEDEQVADASKGVAPLDPRVRDDDLPHPDEALTRILDRPRAAATPVLEDESRDPVEEDRDGKGDQPVPKGDLPRLETRERVPRRGHASRASRALPRPRRGRRPRRSGRR